MARLTSEVKQAFLIELYEAEVKDTPVSLYDAIIKRIREGVRLIKSGAFVTAHSANGHSTSQATGGWAGLTPAEVVAHWAEMRKLYVQTKASLIAASMDSADASVLDEMLNRLEPVYSTQNSYLMLRWQDAWGAVSQQVP